MSDFTFLINEFEKNYIKILKSNLNAINYNKKLGYVSTKDYLSDEEIEWYILTKDVYLEKMIKLRIAIKNVTGDKWPLTIDNISFRDDSKSYFELLYKPLPAYLKNIVNLILQREHIPYTLK